MSGSPLNGPSPAGVSKIDPVSIPGFGPAAPGEVDLKKYKVRYLKIDMDDVASVTELEILETAALRNDGIFILNKDKFVFMDKYFFVVSYLEQESNANSRR